MLAGTQDLMSGISEGDIARWDVNVLEYEYIDKYSIAEMNLTWTWFSTLKIVPNKCPNNPG